MKGIAQLLCLVAIVVGGLMLAICTTAPADHGARNLVVSLPVIIAGGLVGLAILAKDES